MSGLPCPTCDVTFETERGMRVHHARSHGTKLPNRECATCDKEFHSEHERKYCSDACRDKLFSNEGENNPNYRGGKSTTACEIRAVKFDYYPSEKPGRYCTECVNHNGWQTPPSLKGSNHPRWKGGKKSFDCAVCEGTVERYPSNVPDSGVVLCGESCRHRWLSESYSGAGHPNWRGGDVGPYSIGWNAVRRAALKRDKHQCRLCGAKKDRLGRNPDVHHIIPVRAFADAEGWVIQDAHTIENVISLCPSCHRKADFGRISKGRLRSYIAAERPESSPE